MIKSSAWDINVNQLLSKIETMIEHHIEEIKQFYKKLK